MLEIEKTRHGGRIVASTAETGKHLESFQRNNPAWSDKTLENVTDASDDARASAALLVGAIHDGEHVLESCDRVIARDPAEPGEWDPRSSSGLLV